LLNVSQQTTVHDKNTSIEYIGAKFPELVEELHDDPREGLLHVQMGVFFHRAQDSIDAGDREAWKRITEGFMNLWRDCTPDVINALNVSFLEHLDFTDDKKPRSWAYKAMPQEMREAWDEMEAYNRKLHGG
jgi:hypothetical protein